MATALLRSLSRTNVLTSSIRLAVSLLHQSCIWPLLITGAMAWVAATAAQAQPRDVVPTHGAQVLETLSARVGTASTPRFNARPESIANAARAAIQQARETADTRYLGRAQALLAGYWDKPNAPTELAVLQATVQQSRHEFAAAHAVLTSALKRDPAHAQGWLTLATLERVAGRYPAALSACAQVLRAGAALHGAACQLETRSLQGAHEAARHGFEALRRQTSDVETQAWLLSLTAENEERTGQDVRAHAAYQSSLSLAADGYTAIALADLQLRTQQPAQALQALVNQAESDAVLLRRAFALKQMNNSQWRSLATQLQERFAAINQRADYNPATHAREQALAHLWLNDDGPRALQSAQLNLTLQKEPLDWWLALRSTELARLPQVAEQIRRDVAAQGLRDARLDTTTPVTRASKP
jgi:hypothetical protein